MTIEDKLLLIKAGYTKADIEAMADDSKPAPDPKPAQDPKPAPDPTKNDPVTLTWDQLTQLINGAGAKTEPKTESEPKQEPPQAMSPEQYAQLLQAINRGNANIDLPPTNTDTVENMLAGRLKSAFTSANREEE